MDPPNSNLFARMSSGWSVAAGIQDKKGGMYDVASMFSGAACLGEELERTTSTVTLPT